MRCSGLDSVVSTGRARISSQHVAKNLRGCWAGCYATPALSTVQQKFVHVWSKSLEIADFKAQGWSHCIPYQRPITILMRLIFLEREWHGLPSDLHTGYYPYVKLGEYSAIITKKPLGKITPLIKNKICLGYLGQCWHCYTLLIKYFSCPRAPTTRETSFIEKMKKTVSVTLALKAKD